MPLEGSDGLVDDQVSLAQLSLPVVLGDPTNTPVTTAPVLAADKAVSLFADPDNNGVPSPGDTLLYQVIIQNSGNTAAGRCATLAPEAKVKASVGTAISRLKASFSSFINNGAWTPRHTVSLNQRTGI